MPKKSAALKVTLTSPAVDRQPSSSSSSSSAPAVSNTPDGLNDFTVMHFADQPEGVTVYAEKLEIIRVLGQGSFGFVHERKDQITGRKMAVKLITYTLNEKEQLDAKKDLDVNRRASDCPYAVKFYGAMYREGDIWICMEVMDTSLNEFYSAVYNLCRMPFTEVVLKSIAFCIISALQYLKVNLKVMHRDVKPSNILVGKREGIFKICDYGISGRLENSVAKTKAVGAQPYMAPERIVGPVDGQTGFDVRSDVWSFGITMFEVATGRYPFGNLHNMFQAVSKIVEGDPPRLQDTVLIEVVDKTANTKNPPVIDSINVHYSEPFKDFCHQCLRKEAKDRPNYTALLQHDLISDFDRDKTKTEVSEFMERVLTAMSSAENGVS